MQERTHAKAEGFKVKMQVKTQVKAGALTLNHNQTQLRKPAQGFKAKTQVKAGGTTYQHNETQLRKPAQGFRTKTKIKAGALPIGWEM